MWCTVACTETVVLCIISISSAFRLCVNLVHVGHHPMVPAEIAKWILHDMRGDVRHTVFICCAHHSANIVKLFRCVQMIRFHWNSPFSGARNHSKSISGVKWMIRKLFVCMVGTQWTLHLMHTTGAINLNPSHTIRKLYLEQYYIQRWSLKIWKCILAKEALKGAKWSLPNC